MKMKNRIIKVMLIIVMSTGTSVLIAQNHDHLHHHGEHQSAKDNEKTKTNEYEEVSKAFKEQLNQVFTATDELNKLFITEDQKQIFNGIQKVQLSLKNVEMKLLGKGKSHQNWMMQSKALNDALDKVRKALEFQEQQASLAAFNQELYETIKAFGISTTAYYQYCPMALSNRGAHWLSTTKEIKNPYMGNKMLSCGKTMETIN